MRFSLFTLVAANLLACVATAATPDFRAEAKALVARMTLQEKASLCSGLDFSRTKPIERLGIPSIVMSDGPYGLRMPAPGANPSNMYDVIPATCFPTPVALASSWDVNLVRQVGVALGQESQAEGVQILLGPGTNIKRSPLGGRDFEYFSEDPVLAGHLAAAWIEGVQSQGVGASLKHFVANNQEYERMVSDSVVGEQALHEIYLQSFEIAVKSAKPWTVMCSYNKVNGVYASQNKTLLTDVLRKDWGFAGTVVSDWGAVDDRVAGLRAGLNLEMPGSGGMNDRRIVAAVIAGRLPVAELDSSVEDVLTLVLRAKANERPGSSYDKAAHHALARRAEAESMVLLKNDGLLPLDAGRARRIAVVGRFAKFPHFEGDGSSHVAPQKIDSPYGQLSIILGDSVALSYAPGYDVEGRTTAATIAAARDAARHADQVIVFVGRPDGSESEGLDQTSLELPGGQDALVAAVAAVQKNVTVVLMNGSPVAMPWLPQVKAVLEAYLGGEAVGGAIADVLTGRVNPSGKLAETFPARIEDTPTFPNFPARGRRALYGEGVFVGYRSYDARKLQPLFPFGFGLSYTRFDYSSIEADATDLTAAKGTTVHVTLCNVGARTGAEVVELYVSEPTSPVLRPEKALRHFAKVVLAPGKSATVSFDLTSRDFARYDPSVHAWVVDSGRYEILVGGSSRDLPLRLAVNVKGTPPRYPLLTRYSTVSALAGNPRTHAIYQMFMKSVDDAEAKLEAEKAALAPAAYAAQEQALAVRRRSINEVPLCKLVPMSQGQFSEEALEAILRAANP